MLCFYQAACETGRFKEVYRRENREMKKQSRKKYQPDINGRRWSVLSSVSFMFEASPVFTIIQILACIINGLFPALMVIVNALFVDTVLDALAGKKEMADVLLPLSGVIGCLLWQRLSGVLLQYGQGIRDRRLKEGLQNAFLDKIARIAYCKLEMPETQDLIRKTALNPEEHVKQMFDSIKGTGILFLQNFSVFVILMSKVWWAGILIFVGAVPLVKLSLKAGDDDYCAQSEVVEKRRWFEYLSSVMLGKEAVLERTLFSSMAFLNKRYERTFKQAYEVEKRALWKGTVRMKMGGMVSALFALVSTFLLLPGVKTGEITVGMYVSMVNAVFSLVNTMTWNLSYQMENLARGRAVAKDLSAFCKMPEESGGNSPKEKNQESKGFESLEFVDVRFRYPDSDAYILNGVSFRLDAGKHYAFVGKNGAGKSTLIKLMAGLYMGYEGEIFINGRELRDWGQEEVEDLLAYVWQDYAKYSLTVRENLQFSREIEESELEKALEDVGLGKMIDKLSGGLDAALGRLEEGGTDISEGQWQRIAIARAIVNGGKKGKAFILDEPAVSLDPVAENQVYRQFADLAEGKTALFITHRLGAVKDVDMIFVLDGGVVAERGTHAELMEKKGYYEKMFVSQQEWYL